MEEQAIKNLLQQVSLISKRYDEIAKITGEKFNVFKILGVSTQEVRMHSALIAELLNTKGSHGCGAVFLKCFLDQQKENYKDTPLIKRLEQFTIEGSFAKVEQHIGQINQNRTEGGRIDILITDRLTRQIIFENKINAGDQDKQLVRYNNHNKDAAIFYLTLDGHQPSDESKGELKDGEDFVCISYKKDIINWLKICIKEAVSYPLLRETIQQYSHLINLLTFQTINKKMENEIVNIVTKDGENVKAALALSGAIENIKKALTQKLVKALITRVNEKNNEIKVDYEEEAIGENQSGIDFWLPQFEKPYLNLYFNGAFSDLMLGIFNEGTDLHKENFEIEFSNFKIGKREYWKNWVWLTHHKELNDFLSSVDGWVAIANNDFSILNNIVTEITQMLTAIEKIETQVKIANN